MHNIKQVHDGCYQKQAGVIENGKTIRIQEVWKLALNSLEHAINTVNPKTLITSQMALKDNIL